MNNSVFHCRGICLHVLVAIHFATVGCATSQRNAVQIDRELSRQANAGREAYAEGELQVAVDKYHRALLRAWAIDDPYESGTAAYNLAACLVSQQQYERATDWLVDARVELHRANASTGNAWLLSAEIAMVQNRFEDAERFINYASRTCYPCDDAAKCDLRGPNATFYGGECRDSCLTRLPIVGKKIQSKEELKDCRQSYDARLELTRARLAAKQCDITSAYNHLQAAQRLAASICDPSLQSDLHDVAALIYDLEANHLQAAAHRDCEVTILRGIGQYRDLPTILDAAANSYCLAERLDLSIDRQIRAARILLARGEWDEAWRRVRSASEIAGEDGCTSSRIRLALTAELIQQAIASQPRDLTLEPIEPVPSTPDTIESEE